jgi:hypothetical protein
MQTQRLGFKVLEQGRPISEQPLRKLIAPEAVETAPVQSTKTLEQPRAFLVSSFLVALSAIVLPAFPAAAYDTVGVNVSPSGFYQPKIIEMRWTASVATFVNSDPSSVPAANAGFYPLRIEFNLVSFAGALGGASLGVMLQNLLHEYTDASCTVSSMPGGLELYFSVIDDFTNHTNPNLAAGIALAADTNTFPFFARIFQNIDGSGLVGNNIYATAAIGDARISQPVAIEWQLRRGGIVTNPAGNLKKDITCNWVPLSGEFREWTVDVAIDSVTYPVATYYLPEAYASYLDQYSPFILHQEQFGACNDRLDLDRSAVAYYDIAVRTEGDVNWTPIPRWQVNYSYDGVCSPAPSDLRHGIGTAVMNGRKVLISRAGHANDVDMKRCDTETSTNIFTCSTPTGFDGIDLPDMGAEVAISNVGAVRASTTATITWATSAPADGMVEYGATSDYGSESAFDPTFAVTHSVAIRGLQAGTVFYRIESIDASGHLATQDGSLAGRAPIRLLGPRPHPREVPTRPHN